MESQVWGVGVGRQIFALRDAVISEEPESLQQEYVNAVQHRLFGTHFFHVKKVTMWMRFHHCRSDCSVQL